VAGWRQCSLGWDRWKVDKHNVGIRDSSFHKGMPIITRKRSFNLNAMIQMNIVEVA